MAGTRPPLLRAVLLQTGPSAEALIEGEKQGLGPLEELMHVKEGNVEIHVLKSPKLQHLPDYMASKQPNLLYITGGVDGGEKRLDLPLAHLAPLPFMLGPDGRPSSVAIPLFLRALSGLNLFAVYIDAAGSEELGRRVRSLGIPHVVAWPGTPPPRALAAMHFARAFFSHLRTPSVCVAEAFGLASHATRAHAGAPGLDPPLPLLLAAAPPCLPGPASLPPLALGLGLDPSQPPATASPEYGAVRLLAPHAEVRLLLAAHGALAHPHPLGLVCEALRGVLAAEVRRVTLAGAARLEHLPPHLPPGSVALRVQLLSASRAPLTVVVGGPPRVLEDAALLLHALRASLLADAHSLQLKLPPAGVAPPPTRASLAVAAGTPVMEALAVASVWMVAMLKGLCQDKQYRSLLSIGVAAVSVTGVAAFEPTDAARWGAVLGAIASPPGVPGLGHAPGLASPPSTAATATPLGLGALGSRHSAPPSVAGGAGLGSASPGSDLHGAAAAALPRLHRVNGAATAPPPGSDPLSGEDMEEEEEDGEDEEEVDTEGDADEYDNGEGAVLPPALDSVPGQDSEGSEAGAGITSTRIPGLPWVSNRGPLRDCTEAAFYDDLVAFLRDRKGRATTFPVLNGTQLDLFNLYKEVTQRGGFALGNGINWKGQVFPAMHNFTQEHRLTGVGNALKRHYQVCLLDYEQANPQDVTSGSCLVCGRGEDAGDDWISCDSCDRWLHFSCDTRPHPGSFKDYAKRNGLTFVCGPCSEGMESDAPQASQEPKSSGLNGAAADYQGSPAAAPPTAAHAWGQAPPSAAADATSLPSPGLPGGA